MTEIKKKILTSPIFVYIIYKLFLIYCYTFRMSFKNIEKSRAHLENNGRIIHCLWHQQFFPIVYYGIGLKKYKLVSLVSGSNDGDIAVNFMRRMGWEAVRGSSSKGGREALDALIKEKKDCQIMGIVVDGPRGPIGKVKGGAIKLARETQSVIVPLYFTADRYWQLNSWDRCVIPKPFAKVSIIFGDMILCKKDDGSESFQEQLDYLEGVMTSHLIL